jgi:hypothetical protein
MQPELYPEPLDQQETEPIPQHQEAPSIEHEGMHRSQRVRKVPRRQKDYVPHEWITFETLKMQDKADDLQHPILAIKSSPDPDTMYLWQGKKDEDFSQFQVAIQKEINDHTAKGN